MQVDYFEKGFQKAFCAEMNALRMELLQMECLRKQVRRDLGDELEDDVWENLKMNLRQEARHKTYFNSFHSSFLFIEVGCR